MLSLFFNFSNSHLGETLTWEAILARFLVALIISCAIGIDREIKNRPAGMRTHVLVCLGAMLVAMVEETIIADVVGLANPQINVSVGRLTGTIVSGVGFLGAGTIVMAERKIMGLTTAGSLWCTACIGVACGFGYTGYAIISGVIVIGILKLLNKIIKVNTYKKVEVQYLHRETMEDITKYFEMRKIKVLDQDFHSTQENDCTVYTNLYTLSIPHGLHYSDIVTNLSERPNIRAVKTRNV